MEANTCRLTGIPLTEDDVQVLLEACEFTGYQVGKHRMVYQPDTLLEQMERKTQLGQIAGRFVAILIFYYYLETVQESSHWIRRSVSTRCRSCLTVLCSCLRILSIINRHKVASQRNHSGHPGDRHLTDTRGETRQGIQCRYEWIMYVAKLSLA